MKIISLNIKDVRLIEAIELKFAKNGLTQITGYNGAGKTTVIDSLAMLLRGGKAYPTDVVKHGKDEAQIVGTFEGWTIKRKIKKNGTTKSLIIQNTDGLSVKAKPQDFLDKLFNELTFNPMALYNMKSTELLEFLKKLAGVDLTEFDTKIKDKEGERLFATQELKQMGVPDVVEEVEPINIMELFKEKEKIDTENNKLRNDWQDEGRKQSQENFEFNNAQRRKEENIETLQDDIDSTENKIEELVNKVNEIQDEIAGLRSLLEDTGERQQSLPKPEPLREIKPNIQEPKYSSTQDLSKQIEAAGQTNQKADDYHYYLRDVKLRKEREANHKTLDTQVKDLRKQKADALRNAKLPVEGLELREEGVYFNGFHVRNLSGKEKIELSVRLCLAMKPDLEVICIDEGEKFDPKNLALFEETCKKNGIQIIMTRVGAIGKPSDNVIYIEEGRVVE